MLKTLKSSLFRCCMAVLAFAALNMLTPSDVWGHSQRCGN